MKENKYDDNIFFQKYSQMSRSQQGLAGAGEWETLRKQLQQKKHRVPSHKYSAIHSRILNQAHAYL